MKKKYKCQIKIENINTTDLEKNEWWDNVKKMLWKGSESISGLKEKFLKGNWNNKCLKDLDNSNWTTVIYIYILRNFRKIKNGKGKSIYKNANEIIEGYWVDDKFTNRIKQPW